MRCHKDWNERQSEMILPTFYTLPWLLFTFTLSERLRLEVTPSVSAECGKPVLLRCSAFSSMNGLSIKYMQWSQNQTTVYCSVDNLGNLTTTDNNSDFYCDYHQGKLSLHIQKVQPLQSKSPFICKLHSNQGISHNYTRLELQECCGQVEAAWSSKSPTCTFKEVYPDGDVDWFEDSHRLIDHSLISTTKRVEDGGGLTIRSYLDKFSTNVLYNCSLRSTTSGRYLASSVIEKNSPLQTRGKAVTPGPFGAVLWISIVLVVEKHMH